MRYLKYFWRFVLLLLVLAFAGLLFYYLPSTTTVTIIGTEVKRTDINRADPGGVRSGTRDVRYIMARDVESQSTHIFRNEDTRWGWPPYFKFNSSDLAAWATDIAKNQPTAQVLMTYYGVRSTLLDWYPNIAAMEVVPPGYQHIPLFNTIFLVVLGLLLLAVYLRWRRLKKRMRDGWDKMRDKIGVGD